MKGKKSSKTRKTKNRTKEEKWGDYIKHIKNKNKLDDLVEKKSN